MAITVPPKLFFRIGEVATILSLRPHVIRFWESNFQKLAPKKTTTNQRRYTRYDVYRIAIVQFLLHTRGLSIAEAKKQLEALNMTDKGVEKQLSLLGAEVGEQAPMKPATKSAAPHAPKESGSSFLAERERLGSEITRLRTQYAQIKEQHDEAVAKLEIYSSSLGKIRKTSLKGVEELVRILDEKS